MMGAALLVVQSIDVYGVIRSGGADVKRNEQPFKPRVTPTIHKRLQNLVQST
jgi:hypothetical protein